MLKRLFDIIFSFVGIVLLSPFFIIISILIILESKGGFFYLQERVGKDNINFKIIKFRTMKPGSDKKGLLTIGDKDNRVTKIGYFLRKYKLDELPQLINILKGDMSFVGPRPEVRKYVDLYNKNQMKVLTVKPGLTDYSSIEYINESEILKISDNPEKTYIEEVMPKKLELNLFYINNQSFKNDIKIILNTIKKIISK
jgi:lipopolysaccharide/colanic/teichoic acid biosynthesis glycosyltransferase